MASFRMKAVKRTSAEMNQVIAGILRRNGVEDWEYSFEGFGEQRQCMVQRNGVWQVFFVERGRERGCVEFPTQKEAARELLFRLGRTEQRRETLLAELESQWKTVKVMPVREMTIGTIDRVAAAKLDTMKIFDQSGKLVASVNPVEVGRKVSGNPAAKDQGQTATQVELLELRIQELEAHLKRPDTKAKAAGKTKLGYSNKEILRKKLEKKKITDVHKEFPGMGRKG